MGSPKLEWPGDAKHVELEATDQTFAAKARKSQATVRLQVEKSSRSGNSFSRKMSEI